MASAYFFLPKYLFPAARPSSTWARSRFAWRMHSAASARMPAASRCGCSRTQCVHADLREKASRARGAS